MKQINFTGLDILNMGHKIQIAGIIMSDETTDYLMYLPDQNKTDPVVVELSLEEWEKLVQQTDTLETEILAKDRTGKFAKIIIRKSNRQIEQGISWKVYARDNYTCRYCGITAVPMTVDHIICWEVGGPSTEQNLLTACRKCNKLRGNMPYEEWLNSPTYREKSLNLSGIVIAKNREILPTLAKIPLKNHITSR